MRQSWLAASPRVFDTALEVHSQKGPAKASRGAGLNRCSCREVPHGKVPDSPSKVSTATPSPKRCKAVQSASSANPDIHEQAQGRMLRDTSSKKLVEAMQPHDMADFVLNGCGGMQAYRHSQRSSKICRRLFIAPKQARQAQKAGREAPVPGPSSDAQSHPGSVLLESSLSGGLGTARGAARERAPPEARL